MRTTQDLEGNKTSKMIITYILKTKALKFAFGYGFSISSLALLEDAANKVANTNNDFFERILNAVPSKILVWFGVIYAIALVVNQIHKVSNDIRVRNIKLKKEVETLEQAEIETDKQRKELNKE